MIAPGEYQVTNSPKPVGVGQKVRLTFKIGSEMASLYIVVGYKERLPQIGAVRILGRSGRRTVVWMHYNRQPERDRLTIQG